MLRKASEDVSGWRITASGQVACNTGKRYISGVSWVELGAAGRMGEVAHQAPGVVQSSFPAGLMRQGVKWKGFGS